MPGVAAKEATEEGDNEKTVKSAKASQGVGTEFADNTNSVTSIAKQSEAVSAPVLLAEKELTTQIPHAL